MNSLGIRLAVAVVSAFSIVLGIATYGTVRATRYEYLEFYGGGSAIALDIMGRSISKTLEGGDVRGARDLMQSAQEAPTVAWVMLFDGGGHARSMVPEGAASVDSLVLALGATSRLSGAPEGNRTGRRGEASYVTVVALDAMMPCDACGVTEVDLYLAADVSLWALWDYIRRQAWWLGLTLLGAGGIVVVVLLMVVRAWVLDPVERLRAGMARVEKGDLDVFVEDDAPLELAQVMAAFNMMVARLGAARRAVEQLEPGGHAGSHGALTLNTLASTLAHELRSPLAGISGTLQLLGKDLEEGHPQRPLVDEAIHQVDRVTRELDDLLAYARPTASKRTERVDLGRLAARVVAFLGTEARKVDVGLDASIPDEALAVSGDGARLEQVLLNLVQNAIQAASEAGRAPKTVRVAVESRGDDVVLTVADSGAGIAPEERERVFEPFFTTRSDGTGLGLPIVRRLVEAHDGRVTVGESGDGGARFEVVLPAAEQFEGA